MSDYSTVVQGPPLTRRLSEQSRNSRL